MDLDEIIIAHSLSDNLIHHQGIYQNMIELHLHGSANLKLTLVIITMTEGESGTHIGHKTYVSALSTFRYKAETLTVTAEPSSEYASLQRPRQMEHAEDFNKTTPIKVLSLIWSPTDHCQGDCVNG